MWGTVLIAAIFIGEGGARPPTRSLLQSAPADRHGHAKGWHSIWTKMLTKIQPSGGCEFNDLHTPEVYYVDATTCVDPSCPNHHHARSAAACASLCRRTPGCKYIMWEELHWMGPKYQNPKTPWQCWLLKRRVAEDIPRPEHESPVLLGHLVVRQRRLPREGSGLERRWASLGACRSRGPSVFVVGSRYLCKKKDLLGPRSDLSASLSRPSARWRCWHTSRHVYRRMYRHLDRRVQGHVNRRLHRHVHGHVAYKRERRIGRGLSVSPGT